MAETNRAAPRRKPIRVLIAGGGGFWGGATALHPSPPGHDVVLVDNLVRRRWSQELSAAPVVPLALSERSFSAWCERTGDAIPFDPPARQATSSIGLHPEIPLANSRAQTEAHCYGAHHRGLLELGLEPHLVTHETPSSMLTLAVRHRRRTRLDTITPRVDWRHSGPAFAEDRGQVAA